MECSTHTPADTCSKEGHACYRNENANVGGHGRVGLFVRTELQIGYTSRNDSVDRTQESQ